MQITNVRRPSSAGLLEDVTIHIENGMITEIHPAQKSVPLARGDLDGQGWIAAPGWIDIQINGAFGLDFSADPASLWEAAAKLPRFGVAGFLPTVITSAEETYQQAISVLKAGPPPGWKGARPFGWHFEGPFLNPARKGAHHPGFLRSPDLSFIRDWSRANGVLLVTLSPELDGASLVAARLRDNGVVLSAGHTAADLRQAGQAVTDGFRAVTHLFNAMPPLEARSPGIICEALLNEQISAGIIVDGLHVHPKMVELVWRLKGPDNILLISDAVGLLGMPPGRLTQGGMEIVVDENSARLLDGTLAGSILGLDQALRNLIRFSGCRLEQALPALSRNQARLLHLEQNGEAQPGFRADLTFINPNGEVQMTMVGGEVVYP